MRVLAASDIHSSNVGARAVRRAVDVQRPDLTIICGDVTHFGPVSWARTFLESLPGRVFAIPGNCDPPEMASVLEDMGISLHGKALTIGDDVFIGLGGSSPTPFHTLYEISEREIEATLRPLMKPKAILVTHDAPRGHLDEVSGFGSVGSVSIRRLIDEFIPRFSIFGHLHENAGIEENGTVYVNTGGGMFGGYAIIDTASGRATLKA